MWTLHWVVKRASTFGVRQLHLARDGWVDKHHWSSSTPNPPLNIKCHTPVPASAGGLTKRGDGVYIALLGDRLRVSLPEKSPAWVEEPS